MRCRDFVFCVFAIGNTLAVLLLIHGVRIGYILGIDVYIA